MTKFKKIKATEIKEGQRFFVSRRECGLLFLRQRKSDGSMLVTNSPTENVGIIFNTFDKEGNEFEYYVLNE
jgi:hypothetical protein